MPSRNQSGKPEHKMQNPSRKRIKSGKKYPKAIKRWITLLKREQKEGATNRIVATKKKALARFKKYGLKPENYSI